MIDFKKDWGKLAFLLTLIAISLLLVYVQIFHATNQTKLEASLISALQFACSIGFTWLFSIIVFKNTFQDKQKKFAITAFRRIKEIERNIKRTQEHIKGALESEEDLKNCLSVAQFSLLNVQDTINSSISDWADIIEDEIEVSSEIQRLETLHSTNKTTNDNEKIERLIKKLPPELRHQTSIDKNNAELKKEAVIFLSKAIINDGYISLKGFWEARDSFMKNLDGITVGSKLYIAWGITEKRTGVILAYNEQGESLAIITNRCSRLNVSYDIFATALDEVYGRTLRPKMFGGHPVEATVTKIERLDPKSERQYIQVKVFKGVDSGVKFGYEELRNYKSSIIPSLDF